MTGTNKRSRALCIIGAVAFIAAFNIGYASYLSPVFGYFGFIYYPPRAAFATLSWCLASAPAFWISPSLTRPSQIISWTLYLSVYVPSMFVPVFLVQDPGSDSALLMITLFGGFFIIGLAGQLPLFDVSMRRLSERGLANAMAVLTVGSIIYLFLSFGSKLQLVSFEQAYTQRQFDDVSLGPLTQYMLFWLPNVLNPFMLAYGLTKKRPLFLTIGILGQVFVYALNATKGSILSLALYPLLYLVIRGSSRQFGVVAVWGAAALTAAATLISFTTMPGASMLSAIVLMRTFGSPGLFTSQYYRFFEFHPQTYFSHVHGIDLFVRYPYYRPVYIEIGDYFYNNPLLTANAHFWAQDGLAGLGLIGILIMSILCAFVLWAIDSFALGHNLVFSTLCMMFVAINVANSSLFTALTSGGILFFLAIFGLMPPFKIASGMRAPVSNKPRVPASRDYLGESVWSRSAGPSSKRRNAVSGRATKTIRFTRAAPNDEG